MEYEFDEKKDLANLGKRGFGLDYGIPVLRGRVGEIVDDRLSNEERRIAFGLVDGRLYVCVSTMRGEVCRIISVRKANKRECKKWLLLK